MKTRITLTFASSLALLSGLGCSGGSSSEPETGTVMAPQCESASYLAFDSANHESQDIRLQAHADITELLKEAATDLDEDNASDAADKIAEAREIYTDVSLSADLRTKVQGRLDQHVDGDPLQGDRLDDTIIAWLDHAADAETGLEVDLAAQWIDKTLSEFFFLSVHHELLEGAREKWDEAYGYFGSGPENSEGSLLGLALTAFKRDSTNGTSLEPRVYNNFIDGSCVIATALDESDEESMDVMDHDELGDIVMDIDTDMQKVLAMSVGHEAYEMDELLEVDADERDNAEIFVKAAELTPFFVPLERIMLDRGGDSAERAEAIREIIDAWPVSDPENLDLENTDWIDEVGEGAEEIIEAVEAEFDVDVKG